MFRRDPNFVPNFVPRYEIVNQSPVFDLRENVTTLDILFEGKSIRQQRQTLTLLTVRIQNVGNAGLSKQSSFDESFLPGLRVTQSKVVKVDILSASNEYLLRGLKLSRISDNEFAFGPCIMDKGDFFLLKLLVLHSETSKPRVESFGKIAGSGKIEVIPASTPSDQRGFFAIALFGGLAVQAFRVLIYVLAFMVFSVTLVGIISLISTALAKAKRKKHVKLFERSLRVRPAKQARSILDLYQRSGPEQIVRLNGLLSNSDQLKAEVERYRKRSKTSFELRTRPVDLDSFDIANEIVPMSLDVGYLLDTKIILEKDGEIVVDNSAMAAAREFEAFLLHQIPERILRARGQTKPEPYGTESNPQVDTEPPQPSINPPNNV
jgi:hypothetical protein